MLRRILFTRQIDGPESLTECSSSFFRYHYTKGADAAAAASLSVTLREATKRRPFASSIPPRAEWSQNNLLFIGDIRSHSNPGNRFFPSPSLPSLPPSQPLRSVLRQFLCLSLATQLFSQLGIFAQTILARLCARAGEPMHRKPEPHRNLPPFATVENVTSALSWDLTRRESP